MIRLVGRRRVAFGFSSAARVRGDTFYQFISRHEALRVPQHPQRASFKCLLMCEYAKIKQKTNIATGRFTAQMKTAEAAQALLKRAATKNQNRIKRSNCS